LEKLELNHLVTCSVYNGMNYGGIIQYMDKKKDVIDALIHIFRTGFAKGKTTITEQLSTLLCFQWILMYRLICITKWYLVELIYF
jgi:hypothetical protein